MSIIAKTISSYYEFESRGNVNSANTQISRSKIAPSWVMVLLIIAEIGIIAFFAFIYKGKAAPLIQFNEDTIPTLAVVVVSSLVLVTLYFANQRIRQISERVIKVFEQKGVNFLKQKRRLFSSLEGNYRGLKCRLSFGMKSDDTPDYYTLHLLHERKLNLRLVCTNMLFGQTGKNFRLPLPKPFGVVPIDLPKMGNIKCWAADHALGKNLFEDSNIREKIETLIRSTDRSLGRFIIDDTGIKLTFEASVIPEQSLIDLVHDLSLDLGHSSFLPVKLPAPTLKIKLIRSVLFAGILIFMAIFALTILYGHN